MAEITLQNVRGKFENLVSELNEFNSFCLKNEITFTIEEGRDNLMLMPERITTSNNYFTLGDLTQTHLINL